MRKPCYNCRRSLPQEDFYARDRGPKVALCIACQRAKSKAYYAANKGRVNERNRANWNSLRRGRPEYAIWKSAKDRAQQLGREFTITVADVMIPATCPVLGIPLEPGLGRGQGLSLEQRDRRPSIDRRDNSRGYTPDNVVIVSYRANRLKSDASAAEIRALAAFYGGDDASD